MSRAFARGAALGALPALLAAVAIRTVNPWFLDRPLLYALLAMGVPALLLGLLARLVFGGGGSSRRALAGLLAQTVLLLALAVLPRPRLSSVEVMVYGVDGATWDVIDPLIAVGELPAFEELADEGGRGVLRSMEPMFSPLLWTTMATGRVPDVHGVRGFHVRSRDCRVPRFWDVAEQEGGKRIGLYKWLVTSPPRPVQGFVVPAWLAAQPDTWPEELRFVKELELSNRQKRKRVDATRSTPELLLDGISHGLRFGTLLEAATWKVRERLQRPGEEDRRVALEHLRVLLDRDTFFHATWTHEPELATFTLYATDALAHLLWRYHEPAAFAEVDPVPAEDVERWGTAIEDAYRLADDILAELRHGLPASADLLVVSDHGFKALLPGEGNKSYFAPLTMRLKERLSAAVGPVDVAKVGYKLAVSMIQDDRPIAELEAALETLVEADGQAFYRWEPMPDSDRTLGLTLVDEDVTEGRIAQGTVGGEPMSDYVRMDEAFSGDHDDRGVLLAAGPAIPRGEELDEAGLLDIAPTVLGLLGLAKAGDQEGRAIFGGPGHGPRSRDDLVDRLDWGRFGADDSDEVNEERLRQLGYTE